MLLAVDFSSLLYRAYFSMPEHLPAHAVHGFLNMLARVVADRHPTGIAIAVDDDWRPAFRVEAIPSYKAHRVDEDDGTEAGDDADAIDVQEALGRELLDALGVCVVGAEGFEADDVIGTLVATGAGRIEVLSGDRDLFALVRDPDVVVLYPQRGTSNLAVVDEAEITARYDIPGRAYGDYSLLRGDPSDGLPGVRGVGEKTAAKLIREFETLDGILDASELPTSVAKKLDAGRDYLAKARDVIPPQTDVPLPTLDTALAPTHRDPARVAALAAQYELTNAIARFDDARAQLATNT